MNLELDLILHAITISSYHNGKTDSDFDVYH